MTSKSKDVALTTVGIVGAVVGCVLAATPPQAVAAALACSAYATCVYSGQVGFCYPTAATYGNGVSICTCDVGAYLASDPNCVGN